MKKMFLISSVFFALLLMFACNEEQAVNKVTDKEVDNPHYSDLVNPYDSTGLIHNEFLEYHFNQLFENTENFLEDCILDFEYYKFTRFFRVFGEPLIGDLWGAVGFAVGGAVGTALASEGIDRVKELSEQYQKKYFKLFLGFNYSIRKQVII